MTKKQKIEASAKPHSSRKEKTVKIGDASITVRAPGGWSDTDREFTMRVLYRGLGTLSEDKSRYEVPPHLEERFALFALVVSNTEHLEGVGVELPGGDIDSYITAFNAIDEAPADVIAAWFRAALEIEG